MYLGIDSGSVSTNLVVIDDKGKIISSEYIRNYGDPIDSLKKGLKNIKSEIKGVGVTGSARNLIAKVVGGDIVKNEITCHSIAARFIEPDVRTIIEIGGQDSKIIFLEDGVPVDFNMNTVCAAGTGSFLDQQSQRMGIEIERFGEESLKSKKEVIVRGRCGIFVESDMINKQQSGFSKEDIIKGLCDALARNYFNNLAKNKKIHEPVLFQGGVAANIGMKNALEKISGKKLTIPKHYNVMGALGAALLARNVSETKFKGVDLVKNDFVISTFICKECSNYCEISVVKENKRVIAHLGSRCGKWS